jgi:hypothetical protein
MSPKEGTTKYLTHPNGVGYLIHTARERPQRKGKTMFVYKIDYWANSLALEAGSKKQAVSTQYKTRDRANSAMTKALKATDTLNELGITDISAMGIVEEVSE